MNQLEQIDLEIENVTKKYNIIFSSPEKYNTFEAYHNALAPHEKKIMSLDRKKRMLIPCILESKILDDSNVMSLKDFIDDVNCGNFIDYDGYGYYVSEDMITNIKICPSDVNANSIRKEFDKIIWYNR